MLHSSRLTGGLKDKRFLWGLGLFRNQEIAACFGIGYSSVSQRVRIVKKRLRNGDSSFSLLYKELSAKIKM